MCRYYLSLAYVASLLPGMRFANSLQSLPELCSTVHLRSTNAFLAIICSVLVYDLLITLRPSLGERKATTYAIVIALYPVHWFFTFLYYTDVASVAAVLAMLLACLKKQYWFSAMVGALAILFRQTNVVWMMFVAANGAIRFAEEFYPRYRDESGDCNLKISENDATGHKSILTASTLRRRRADTATNTTNLSNSEMIEKPREISGCMREMLDIASNLWTLKWQVLFSFAPFLLVLMASMSFVIWNGSIVLGAKEAHAVSPHFAQMMYFAVVSASALAPCHFSLAQVTTLFQLLGRNKICSFVIVLIALSIGFTAVHVFSMNHLCSLWSHSISFMLYFYSSSFRSNPNRGCFSPLLPMLPGQEQNMSLYGYSDMTLPPFQVYHGVFISNLVQIWALHNMDTAYILECPCFIDNSRCIAHPYLLADNRHYPFYIWRKVIQAHWMVKYLLVPLYIYSWISIVHELGKIQKKFWVLSFVIATALVLVPAPLVEFRYYTIPFFLLFLHSNIEESWQLLSIGVLYVLVDIFTMVMFLFRPFHWDHEPGVQRFIW